MTPDKGAEYLKNTLTNRLNTSKKKTGNLVKHHSIQEKKQLCEILGLFLPTIF